MYIVVGCIIRVYCILLQYLIDQYWSYIYEIYQRITADIDFGLLFFIIFIINDQNLRYYYYSLKSLPVNVAR